MLLSLHSADNISDEMTFMIIAQDSWNCERLLFAYTQCGIIAGEQTMEAVSVLCTLCMRNAFGAQSTKIH